MTGLKIEGKDGTGSKIVTMSFYNEDEARMAAGLLASGDFTMTLVHEKKIEKHEEVLVFVR